MKRAGRPSLPAARKRGRRVGFAVSDSEYERLALAAAPGRVGPAVRTLALDWARKVEAPKGERPPSTPDLEAERRAAAREIGKEIAALGRLLNQAVKRLHAQGRTDGLAARTAEAVAAVAQAEGRFGRMSWS